MRPFQHARSSARRSGRHWREDLEIHEFIDSTKFAFPDLRHRMILHSVDLGGELAARSFPDRPDARRIVRDHVLEDLGEPRTLRDWLEHCRLDWLPRPDQRILPLDPQAMIQAEQKRQKLASPDGPRAVMELLQLPEQLAPEFGLHAWSVLANAFGPAVVRRVLGSPREMPGAEGRPVIFDPAWCAEQMIFRFYHGIPDLRSVVAALRTSHQRREPMITPEQAATLPRDVLRGDWAPEGVDEPARMRLVAELESVARDLKALDVDPIVIAVSPDQYNDEYSFDRQIIRIGEFLEEAWIHDSRPAWSHALQNGPTGFERVKEALDLLERVGWRDLFIDTFRLRDCYDYSLALVIQEGVPWLVFDSPRFGSGNHVFTLWGDQPLSYFGECEDLAEYERYFIEKKHEMMPLHFRPASVEEARIQD